MGMNELISKLQTMHEEWLKNSQLAMAATHDEQKAKCIAADKFSVQIMEMIPEIVDASELEAEKESHILRWTKEPPKKIGWYFLRQASTRQHVQVVRACGEEMPYNWENAEWAGPLPEPVEE